MRARLLCRAGPLQGKDFEVVGKLTIGRSAGNSVVLPSRMISGEHAQIVFDDAKEKYFLEDLGSLNGTTLDGIAVHGRERLDRLHVVSFAGAFDFIWQGTELCADLPELAAKTGTETGVEGTWSDADVLALPAIFAAADGEAPPAEPAGSSSELEGQGEPGEDGGTQADFEILALPPGLVEGPPAVMTPEEPQAGGFVLVMTHQDRMRRVRLRSGENLVGRRQGAEVYIDSTEVSRRHAVLTVSGSTVRLRDEGSRNHTYLNGQRFEGEVEVQPGAQVRFGMIEALLVQSDESRMD